MGDCTLGCHVQGGRVIDDELVSSALRARGEAISVRTTGSASLAATAVGYTRQSGSFITDDFVAGMEVAPTNFTQATPGLVTAVSALLLTIKGGRTAQASGAGRTLSVGLPALRFYDNEESRPIPDRWFAEGEYSPSRSTRHTVTASRGAGEMFGEFYWRLYCIAGLGGAAINAVASTLLLAYPPGLAIALDDGSVLHIAGGPTEPGPRRGSLLQDAPGRAVLTVTVPWRCSFTNPVL